MSGKLDVLKLLWLNIKTMKQNNIEMDDRFNFLNESEMVSYLHGEEEKWIELLLLSVENQPLNILERINPVFVELYNNFYSTDSKKKNLTTKTDKVKDTFHKHKQVVETNTKNDTGNQETNLKSTEMKDDTNETQKTQELQETNNETSSIASSIDSDSDSDADSVDSDADSVDSDADSVASEVSVADDNGIIKFLDNLSLTEDNNKVSVETLVNKYNQYCEENNLNGDDEEFQSSLVEKFGKPKGKKKPVYKGLVLNS